MKKPILLEESWLQHLAPEFEKPYFEQLRAFLLQEQSQHLCFPPNPLLFNAFDKCPWEAVKVVILGQDPYHGPGQAHGLCFSVPDGVRFPPSLLNIFKALQIDLGCPIPSSGNLERWANEGVFLLNTTLSVRAHTPLSHQNQGWEVFTDAVIQSLSSEKDHLVFLLWGSHAQSKEKWIDGSKHLVLKSVHPSPLSAHRGFLECRHFSQANDFLQKSGQEPICW